jgi:hypothetical protein
VERGVGRDDLPIVCCHSLQVSNFEQTPEPARICSSC